MTDDSLGDLRASDADRERTAEVLRRAGGEGMLEVDELEERLSAVYGARTRGELARLTHDISLDTQHGISTHTRVPVRQGSEGQRRLVAVMSGHDRKGRWRLAPKLTVVNVMGGSNLDLNDAEFSAAYTEMTVYSIMGGADIRVPEGLNVEISDFGFMGGNDVDVGDERPDPGGPTLHIKVVSVMGGASVRRGRKLTKAEKRRQKELRESQR